MTVSSSLANAVRRRGEWLKEARSVLERVVEHASQMTAGGRDIDAYQMATRKIAGMATRLEAAEALSEYAIKADARSDGEDDALETVASLFAARSVQHVTGECEQYSAEVGLEPDAPASGVLDGRPLREALHEAHFRQVGRGVLERPPGYEGWIWTEHGAGEEEHELRESTRRFAQRAVAPRAEEIHRNDLLVPEEIVREMSSLGYFGMSIPEEYGGVGMGSLMMVLATEELSAASLPAAGSLITRPEILTRALLKGGTEQQRHTWLPKIASGELMVAIAVTEPNVGSDVASLTCSAAPATMDGHEGYALNGAKAWTTFAGRAEMLALLARTDPDPKAGHRGLSLFIVEKDPFTGHAFEMVQRGGGRVSGKADATLGYRGMHSFTLQFTDYFVPAENLVGGAEGKGRGFYLQMDGFAAGRLQTGGRAAGLAQASLEAAQRYALERPQFGKPIAEFQSTEYELGFMAVEIEAARQLTYAAARAMDRGDGRAALLAAMAKLFACRTAVDVSQRAQVLHGGWGYAEEYAISRYVADALVLPIFEGVEPILEMKVIGRALLSANK